jgi:ferredoxin
MTSKTSSLHLDIDHSLCTGCGLCEERAPENLEVPPGESAAQVVKQPEGDMETKACTEAAAYCPTGGLTAQSAETDPATDAESEVSAA